MSHELSNDWERLAAALVDGIKLDQTIHEGDLAFTNWGICQKHQQKKLNVSSYGCKKSVQIHAMI